MLAVERLSKRFGSINALRDVSFTVGAGEIVALVGENGAGKSSLVRCVARATAPDSGRVLVDGRELGRTPADAIAQGVAVVWQDLALCCNLDITGNLFLGRELRGRLGLRNAAMSSRARSVLDDLGARVPDLDQTLDRLSGGQRQIVAIARATLDQPRVLILDEPTAALGVSESQSVLQVVRRLQARGVAIMLVSHQLDDVFDLADRIVVLRHGHLVADLHQAETHPDDVVALITGADVETMAGRQLQRLHSLSEQLADAEQSSVLPLTVNSLSDALDIDRLAVFLVDEAEGGPVLRRSATLHLPERLVHDLTTVPVGPAGGFLGLAARQAGLQVVPTLTDRPDDPVAALAVANGLSGAWATSVVGQGAPLGVIAGFTDGAAHLQRDQVRLLELFSTMAGATIERGRLVETLRSRNRSLQGIQGVLEALAGPHLLAVAMDAALDALCQGVDADYATLLLASGDDGPTERASATRLDPTATTRARTRARAAIGRTGPTGPGTTDVEAEAGLTVVPFTWSRGSAWLVCLGGHADAPSAQVVAGTARTLRLALERELAAEAEREAMALQRSRALERALTRRLGHELRTPLTAIRGFASTMLQTDVEWGEPDKRRFLEIIESEAGRTARLVAQLFDDSAMASGTLRLDLDDCDLSTVIERAVSIAADPASVRVEVPPGLIVWGDRDRLEQLFVNLVENAVRHNGPGTTVTVRAVPDEDPTQVRVTVADTGAGLPDDVVDYYNGHSDELHRDRGLGVRLARGFVRAHRGRISARVGPAGSVIDVALPIEGGRP